MERCGALGDSRYLLHDRDTKYTASFLAIIESAQVKTLQLPTRSPNLNAHSERWVISVREEYLSKSILFGERSLRRAMRAKSSGKVQRPVISSRHRDARLGAGTMPRATGWAFAFLPSRGGVDPRAISNEVERYSWLLNCTLRHCLRRSPMANSCHALAAVDQRCRNRHRESTFVSIFLPYGFRRCYAPALDRRQSLW